MQTFSTHSDFGDWLSPMLVKELRQGIRSKVFMAAFFLTQLLMILSVIFSLTTSGDGDDGNGAFAFVSGLFWFMIAVPLLFLMPLRGFGSLFGEIKSGTLELVFLTRLSALRIAAGKWTALMVQTLLLVAAVLPYVLLRYFLGGVDVVDDLLGLLFMVVISGMLTAATIALSPYESRILRAFFGVGMIFGFLFLMGRVIVLMSMRTMGAPGGSMPSLWMVLFGAVLFVPAFIFLCLEIAASKIAPPAENHAIRKRLTGFYLLIAASALVLLGSDATITLGFSLVLITLVVFDALAEPQQYIRSVYLPFLRRGAIGKFGALWLTPGWVSASWFVAILTIFGAIVFWAFGELSDPAGALKRVAFVGWLIFPAAVVRLFAPGTKYFLGFYLAQQFFYAVLTLLVSMMANISGDPMALWLCPLPPCTFLLSVTEQVKPEQIAEILVLTGVITAASLGVLLVRSIAPLRDIRAALSQTARQDA
jgi:hypothetical protein